MRSLFLQFDRFFIDTMRKWGIPMLRVALGIVFLWFGALKVLGISPVADIVSSTYSFLPQREFLLFLGIWEVLIGIGLLARIALRVTLALLWLQMAGTLIAPILNPALFFAGSNPFFLTSQGEFVVKNLVLIASSIVIGGHEVTPKMK